MPRSLTPSPMRSSEPGGGERPKNVDVYLNPYPLFCGHYYWDPVVMGILFDGSLRSPLSLPAPYCRGDRYAYIVQARLLWRTGLPMR